MNHLEKLLYQRGVSSEYFSYSGERLSVAYQSRMNFLRAMNYDIDDATQIESAVFDLDAKPWKSWLPEHCFAEQGKVELHVHPDELEQHFDYKIITECGRCVQGNFSPRELCESGEYYIAKVRYTARQWTLPSIPFGYHELRLSSGGEEQTSRLIFAPDQCYLLNKATAQNEVLGISCQLYTLRSERNWGIGDFADLRELIELSAGFGIELIGLNPLHAPMSGGVHFSSPYSPSDRRFLNSMYIAPELVAEFPECRELRAYMSDPQSQSELAMLRTLDLIDYPQVEAIKSSVFALLFNEFVALHLSNDSPRAEEYNRFVASGGEKLQEFCRFEVARAVADNAEPKASSSFLLDHRYHSYLQWNAQQQLANCQTFAVECGMRVGLMGDLAVGAVKNGAEVVGNPTLFRVGATIGAPPDQFTDNGQNWDLPAIDPLALKNSGYQHFIDLMQANMANYGALRIDHVMGLMRLWWWLENSQDGAYVYYPLEHLLTILRLESHRNSCLVIGEDMGVVSDEFRDKMAESAITRSKVFYFETNSDGSFVNPQTQYKDALLMITNHDVPTLAGWWVAGDIASRDKYNLFNSSQEFAAQLAQRQRQKGLLLEWLNELDLLPQAWQSELQSLTDQKPLDLDLCGAIIKANAHTNCQFMLYQLDDLQLISEPVNIPGTFLEHPNWQRKQRLNTSAIFADPQISNIMSSIHHQRLL